MSVLRCGFALAGVWEISPLSWLSGEGFLANAKSLVDGVFRGVSSPIDDEDCRASDKPTW